MNKTKILTRNLEYSRFFCFLQVFIIKIKMRKSDKKKNFLKVNLLAEQRYLQSKGVVSESFHGVDGKPIGVDHMHRPVNENNEMDLESNPQLLDSIISQISEIVAPYIGVKVADKAISNHNLEVILTAFNQRFSRNSKFKDEFGKEYTKPSLGEEYVSEAEGTDLEYITFVHDGQAYRPSKVINTSESSNSFTVEFGLDKYINEEWVPVGGMLTYYFDMDTRTDKLLFTDGRFGETIDAKKMIDTKYGLYEKIKQYVETRL